MLGRKEALELVRERITNKNLVKHCLAVEAGMRALARHFNEDEEFWGLTGLLHDIDYDETAENPERHGLLAPEILAPYDLPSDMIHAIKAHPGHLPRESLLDKALYAVDPLTGLIVAATLMHPTKKLSAVDLSFVMRRFKEKHFARGAKREEIKTCEGLGISLEEFIEIVLSGMKGIADELGL
jgi:putative nucleotidyltransferase with HDIG domain